MNQTIVEIRQLENGAHNNQTIYNTVIGIPKGWAWLPESVATPEVKNYPYADIVTETIRKDSAPDGMDIQLFGDRNEIDVITAWTPLDPPPPEPVPEPTPAEKRKQAYETEPIINWPENSTEMLTVDQANQLWLDYTAEGKDEIANKLRDFIASAKADIRERYPDET